MRTVQIGARHLVLDEDEQYAGHLRPHGSRIRMIARGQARLDVSECDGTWDVFAAGHGHVGVACSPADGLLMVARVRQIERDWP